ncbi:TPA: peptide chain release factor 1 [Candidatus Sumerlaeota bacterium]|jgi:peptide chain release factor 1|nr:peptide chain release factor 1 [Candidatus Sumerlaeota bacterium]
MDLVKLCNEMEAAYAKVEISMADPAVLSDQAQYRDVAKRHREIGRIVNKWREYQACVKTREEAQALSQDSDPDMAAMAQAEMAEADEALPRIERELTLLLLPSDPMDDKNTVMEIRAGTGGEEAALFAADLFRMYSRYAERQGWKVEMLSDSPTELGGFKEVIFGVSGERVFSRMKFESGTHRVQRVPETETQGRIHTSAITVAVMPEAEEVDIEIRAEDVRVDVYRSSGNGGQSVNTTDSAVRVTHLPTGLIVTCQDEKSQIKNRAKALKVLRSRLYDMEVQKKQMEEKLARREQVGTGDRSERIRTYNYPQNRLTDHRIGLTLYKLDYITEGEMDELINALMEDEQSRKLAALGDK